MAVRVQLVDPTSGAIFSVDEGESAAAQREHRLVPATPEQVQAFQVQERSGGALDAARTVPETAAATVAQVGSQLSQLGGPEVDVMGNPVAAVAPVPAANLAPAAFTPEALERRAANPIAAQVGAALPEAATLLIPGAGELGWAARLGLAGARAAVSGGIAEAGQSVISGEEFSPAKAAFYGIVGESLGALASGGIGRLMRSTGKAAPEALEVAARKATKADVGDALGELADSPLKAQKLADNATELTSKATDELGEAFRAIEERVQRAEGAMFSKPNVARSISKNLDGQQDAILTQGAKLDQLAFDLSEQGLPGYGKRVREGVDELLTARAAPDLYLAARKVARDLVDEAPAELPQAAREVIGKLDDLLADESVWGGVAKAYGASRTAATGRSAFASDLFEGGTVNRAKVANLFEPTADRTQLAAYLDAAETAARQGADKPLRKAIETARTALASGDDVLGAKVLTQTFGKTAADFVADKLVGRGLKYGLGAVGLGHGPAGVIAGAAAGEFLAPKVASAIRGPLERAIDSVAGKGVSVDGTRNVLQALERSANTQISTAGRALTNATLRAAQSTIKSIAAPTMSVGIARFMGGNDSIRSAYSEKRELLDKLSSNPALLVEEMTESLGSLADTAPQLHAALVAKTVQAVAFIRTKMPATIGASLASPSGIPPSELAVRQFALYYTAATDPSSVVEDVKNNRVRAEQMEALKAVWPEVYADLRSSVLAGMTTSRATPQQRIRMDILFDFGSALDAGLSWNLALEAEKARAAQAQATPKRGGGGGTARTIAALQPAGIAALANPQGMA